MAEYHKYSIRQNRFRRSFLSGLQMEKEDVLRFDEKAYRKQFLSSAIDGAEEDAEWGRLHLDMETSEDMVVTVYAVALNVRSSWMGDRYVSLEELLFSEDVTSEQRRQFFESHDAKKAVNQQDILLYDLSGRYLYLLVDIQGLGEGSLSHIWVDNQGDLFMDTFPEVYREKNSFFHRYLSVFSSMYMDFQTKIDNVADLLDVDTAPAELLPIFCSWMGVDVSGDFLSEDRLRLLVKEAYQLNRKKGTRASLERVAEIILGEKVILLEKNVLRGDTQTQSQELYEKLYGEGAYDVTMLVSTYVPEHQKSQMLFLLNQFRPVRSRLRVRFLEAKGELDDHTYMDTNAYVESVQEGSLDERQDMDGAFLLME